MKIRKGLKHLPGEERLRELALVSLEKRFREDLNNVYKSLRRGCREDGTKLLSVVPSARTRDSGHTSKHRRHPLNIWKHFFTVRVVTEYWHRPPRLVLESPLEFTLFT